MSENVERMVPLYEAKMVHHYDHRWATYEPDGSTRDVTLVEKQDPEFVSLPRYWVRESVVSDRLEGRWDREWLLGWRDICRSTDERTMIAAIDGAGASPEGGTLLTMPSPPEVAPLLLATWNSFAFDFVARQKVGGTHLKYFTIRQLPVPDISAFDGPTPWSPEGALGDWISRRVVALVADAVDMAPFAADFGASVSDSAWAPEERSGARAELDAAMFLLFGIAREDVDYVMETFHIVKRKDMAAHGEFRTKRLILDVYDQMVDATSSGTPYSSHFDG